MKKIFVVENPDAIASIINEENKARAQVINGKLVVEGSEEALRDIEEDAGGNAAQEKRMSFSFRGGR